MVPSSVNFIALFNRLEITWVILSLLLDFQRYSIVNPLAVDKKQKYVDLVLYLLCSYKN